MRASMRLAAGFAAALDVAADSGSAADVPSPESLLNGTRWMEIGVFDSVETIAPEKLLLLRDCFIADVAFLIEDGKLTRFDRGGLSGNSAPVAYPKVDAEPGQNGATLVTLHTTAAIGDMPVRYLIDAGGDIMHAQLERGQGSAYMKCDRGVSLSAQPSPPRAP
jgi:hypothetical protein